MYKLNGYDKTFIALYHEEEKQEILFPGLKKKNFRSL